MTIKLRKRKTEKRVEWSSDTIDNEHLGRRSSKCRSQLYSVRLAVAFKNDL